MDGIELEILWSNLISVVSEQARALQRIAFSPVVREAGDLAAAAILDIILRDEVGHVDIGNRWYGYLCGQRGLAPLPTYAALAVQYAAPVLRGPFNLDARRRAGFTEEELAAMEAGAAAGSSAGAAI